MQGNKTLKLPSYSPRNRYLTSLWHLKNLQTAQMLEHFTLCYPRLRCNLIYIDFKVSCIVGCLYCVGTQNNLFRYILCNIFLGVTHTYLTISLRLYDCITPLKSYLHYKLRSHFNSKHLVVLILLSILVFYNLMIAYSNQNML